MRLLLASALVLTLMLSGCLAGVFGDDTPSAVTYDAIAVETSIGPMTVILYPDAAPETVQLYLDYVEEGYFDGRGFGRVIPGFVIQLTDRTGVGATEDGRRVPLETKPGYSFGAGALGIARDADPNSGGPEFFIMDFAAGHLEGNYTVFGQVVEGMEVVRQAARVDAVDGSSVYYTQADACASAPDPAPCDPVFLFDRLAIDPVTITATQRATVTLEGAEAIRYPLQVAPHAQDDVYRYTMDWGNDLALYHETDFTTYIRARDGETPVPSDESLHVRVDGAPQSVRADAWEGIFHWSWTPATRGDHLVELMDGNQILASWTVAVQ